MQDYVIDVSRVEELQMTSNVHELDIIFERGRSAIVNGAKVILARKKQKFDELTTLKDFEAYRTSVMKYL
jgi:hypothetical protein